jgi:hypothetical protein
MMACPILPGSITASGRCRRSACDEIRVGLLSLASSATLILVAVARLAFGLRIFPPVRIVVAFVAGSPVAAVAAISVIPLHRDLLCRACRRRNNEGLPEPCRPAAKIHRGLFIAVAKLCGGLSAPLPAHRARGLRLAYSG